MTERWYMSPTNSEKYRLIEAEQDRLIYTTRADYENGVIGDSMHCLEAKAANRQPGVIESFIGAGRDSVIVEKRGDELVAVHYTNSASSARIRDAFDQSQKLDSYLIILKKVAPSEGFEARAHRFQRNRAIAKLNKTDKPETKTEAKTAKTPKKIAVPAKAKVSVRVTKKTGSWPKPKEKATAKPKGKYKSRMERFGVPRRAFLPIITKE